MKNTMMKLISRTLMLSVLSMSIMIPVAQATMITGEQVANNQVAQQNRERVLAFFDRKDVQAQLQARGVSTESAKARVNSLTDNEIASINGHLDSLPAGGVDILGVFLLAIIILIITDLLGLTKVFTFTKKLTR